MLLSLMCIALLSAVAGAQQIVRIPVPYHSQIPPGDPNVPANWPWTEPGNAAIPNGYCTCACLDMLFNYWTGGGCPHNNPPLPQQEFAAVANTNDCMGGGTYSGTYPSDARRAVHFSPTSPAWPCNPPAYINPNNTGYSWPLAWPLPGPRSKYGMVGIDGNWATNGWTIAQFKQVLALGYPIIVNVNASAVGDSLPEIDPEDSDSERTGYDSVEDTVVGHSIVVRGYNNQTGHFLIHDPTLGPALRIRQGTFWNYWWQSKDFLLVAPWTTTISIPALGSLVPNGFQVSATATYTDPLPTAGTGVTVQAQGKLSFFPAPSGTLNSALAQGQPQTINYNQVVRSGQSQMRSWQCVTCAHARGTVAVAETWGRVNAVAHSFPGGYTDDIGSMTRGTVNVPRPVLGDISICHIPRVGWWRTGHITSSPHDYAPGVPNDFVVEVGNRGVLPLTDVYVDFYYGDPSLVHFDGQPDLMPFGMTVIPYIGPGETVETDPIGFVAGDFNGFSQPYFDFFVRAHCADDVPHDLWVEFDNDLSMDAVHHVQIAPYSGTYLEFWIVNPDDEPRTVLTRIDKYLPEGWTGQLHPAGVDSLEMGPGENTWGMVAVEAADDGIGMIDVYEDVYDGDHNFVRRTGGLSFLVWTTGTGIPDDDAVVTELALAPPVPNPASGVVDLSFALPEPEPVDLAIYDVAGRLVARVYHGTAQAGWNDAVWGGVDDSGNTVASGVYLARLTVGDEVRSRKVVLVR